MTTSPDQTTSPDRAASASSAPGTGHGPATSAGTADVSGTAAATAASPTGTPLVGGGQGAEPGDDRSPRLGTIVWGLVLLMLGVFVVAVAIVGKQLDVQLALIAVLTVAGVGMLLGAVLQMRRR